MYGIIINIGPILTVFNNDRPYDKAQIFALSLGRFANFQDILNIVEVAIELQVLHGQIARRIDGQR